MKMRELNGDMLSMTDTLLPPGADEDIHLTHGDLHLTVSAYGASLRGLTRGEGTTAKPIVTSYEGAKNKIGGQGDVLIPYPGRVNHGAYTFDGHNYQLPLNDKEGPNSIHGFLRTVIWDVAELTADTVTFETHLNASDYTSKGYPFSLQVKISYGVGPDGLTCSYIMKNVGDNAAPVAAGFHPYFTVGSETIDNDILHVPFEGKLEFNDDLIPTGVVQPVSGTDFDFLEPRTIGKVEINTCYVQPLRDADGRLRVSLQSAESGDAIVVWMDESFDYVVLYSGDVLPAGHERRALAIEPMTCASDAFNRHEWGLVSLAPGEETRGNWGVTDKPVVVS